ncbi:MAG: VanW family protein [Bacillota bacterium]|nr:VanW family protein [Bacillota bacterium]
MKLLLDWFQKTLSKKMRILLVSACVLTVALAVLAVFLISDSIYTNSLMEGTTIIRGVSVSGVDVSGMTREEARVATASVPGEVLGQVDISINVEGEIFKYASTDLSLGTDYDAVIDQALSYAHTGTIEERRQAAQAAQKDGVDFPVHAATDRATISAVLLPLKAQQDQAAVDAAPTFTPWGHLAADGSAYQPDTQEVIKSCANGKLPETPPLELIPDDQMPNKLRYQYWRTDHYVADYIPLNANISRFTYTDGKNGRSVNMEAVIDAIISQMGSGSYSEIAAPVEAVEPAVKLPDIKYQTQLISSWTSSYASHNYYERNWNVAKLSGIINGAVIQPGEVWSINGMTGERILSRGWLDAYGIAYGGYTLQPGGGVCQISSTTYNAAIRAGLEITASTHHSITSGYIPLGLDATISSPGPDLKIKNNYTTPVYIVSYLNPPEKNVTVEIYGPPVTDPQNGEVILDFSFKDLGTYGTPVMVMIYNTPIAPDGTVILPGGSYEYAENRLGQEVQTYKHYLRLDGTEIAVENFTHTNWKPKNGKTYVNGPDPATVSPTPESSPP